MGRSGGINMETENKKEKLRLEIDGHRINPSNNNGLENYHFSMLYGTVFVYHYTEYKKSHGGNIKNWLSCSSGWRKRADGKWTTAIDGIGWKYKTVETMEDIFNLYREGIK